MFIKVTNSKRNKDLRSNFVKILDRMRVKAMNNNLDRMTLEEINEIIRLTRKEKGLK